MESIFSLTDHEIYAITAKHNNSSSAMIATWVIPATLVATRPRIVAAISSQNYTYQLIRKSKQFACQLLSENQFELVTKLGLYSGSVKNKLDDMETSDTARGNTVIKGTCGWCDCRVIDMMDSGDRMIILADVLDSVVKKNHTPLRKKQAFEKLSAKDRELLLEKRENDAKRDAKLIKLFE